MKLAHVVVGSVVGSAGVFSLGTAVVTPFTISAESYAEASIVEWASFITGEIVMLGLSGGLFLVSREIFRVR